MEASALETPSGEPEQGPNEHRCWTGEREQRVIGLAQTRRNAAGARKALDDTQCEVPERWIRAHEYETRDDCAARERDRHAVFESERARGHEDDERDEVGESLRDDDRSSAHDRGAVRV